MAPSRRKAGGKAAAIAAACRQWKVGDLVLAKLKGFPAWPAAVSEPEKWGYTTDWKKVLVHFFGTQQIAFCNPSDVEAFTEEKKQSLLTKRHAKGSDFVRAVKEITASYENLKQQEQAGDPKSEEATLESAENATLLPQVSENPTGTSVDTQMKSDPSHGRDESTLLNEDASAAEQMLALRDNSAPRNKACDSALVKEPRKIATYSSRRRNGGARSQKCAPQKKICSVQRSKSSSRSQSDKLQSSMVQCSNGGQSIDDVEDGSLRRRKRIRRSSGHSESDDVASSALNSHGSDEENASEIATVESNNNTRTEGNGVDSGSKVEHSDTGGQFLGGDYELNKGLNFQISTMVKRKKRKPTRKRGTSDAVDPPAKVDAEAVLEVGARDNVHTSQNSHERFAERPSEENGDEHLPLVKRARVRMSRAFYGEHEANGSSQVEERSSKDTLVSATAQTSPSDIVSSHDTSAVEESKSFEVFPKPSGDMVNVVPSPVGKPSDGMSLAEACVQTVGDREYPMGWNELSKAPDDEAAGPQSNQVRSLPADEAQTASVSEAVCSGDSQPTSESDIPVVQCIHQVVNIETDSQPMKLQTSESDLPVLQCVHQVAKIETDLQPMKLPTSESDLPVVHQIANIETDSQPMKLPTSESDLPVLQCVHQVAKIETDSQSVKLPTSESDLPVVECVRQVAKIETVSQPMKLPTSESDLPVVECVHQVAKIETPLDPNIVDSSANKASGICSSAGPQSNQVSSLPADEVQTASVPEAVCSVDSQSMKLPTIESDLPVVQCLHQVAKIETPLDPNIVDSSANKVSGICSSGVSSHLSGQYRSQDQDACDSLDNSRESLNVEGDRNGVSQVVQSEAQVVQHRCQDQDACDSLGNSRESLYEEGDRNGASQVVQSEAIEHSPSSCLMVNKQETEDMQKAENMLLKEEHVSLDEEYDNVTPIQSTPNPPISESEVIVDENEPPNESGHSKCEDAVEDCRQLEIIGEADDQKQQVQTNNSVSVSENLSREKMSLSPANIADTPARGTPHSNSVCQISTAESANDMQNNSSCSPNVQPGEKKTVCDTIVKEEEKIEAGVCQGQKVVTSDVQTIRESFEDALSSLVRTKESIGRATRLAMDLMKVGVSAKAMEILAHTLESESNLQRRVDLFFLVDSIAQCSKGLKGDAGYVYLSAIQVILPRLLAAAVPAGATTQENRRQCLKVLRVWLERRILPESIIRHHIRELDSHSVVPACLYSRRSARTERSLDDPVRDMEGMLVDEYGSNSTLQLPGFCMPAMLKDEEDESDSDGGGKDLDGGGKDGSDSDGEDFEPVTPEHESRNLEEPVSSSAAERHTLILEDVDGELEMEDVAPPWETGNCANTENRPVSGTSHQHVSYSSPPLQSCSPPPPLPPPQQQAQCDSYSNGFENGGYTNMHHGDHQRMNPPLPGNTMHYQGGPESSYSMPHGDGSSFQHRPYPSHPHPHAHPPPPPPPQHQYPYTEAGHHMKSRRDGPSYSHNRSHYGPSYEERNFHDNHERMRHGAAYENNRDNWRYPPSSSSTYGSTRYQEKHKGPPYPSSSSYNGGGGGAPRQNNSRWDHPPRPYNNNNNRHSFHPKPHSEGPPVPVGMRDPGMWHQRGD